MFQSLFCFHWSCQNFYVLVKQAFNYQHVFFLFFSSYYSFHQFFVEQCFNFRLLVLFFDLVNENFALLEFIQLSLLIKIIEFRQSRRRCFFSVRLFIFATAAYDSIVVVILLMFCSMFLYLLFIFLNFAFIVISTINVENRTTTRRSNDNCKLESIIFAILSRSKIWISFFIWAFRLNRDKFVRAFCVLATSSRRLSSDDITSIHTSCYALIRIRKRDYTSVYKASKVWLL